MSVTLMGKVWASGLPSDQKFVALALADFADDEGGSIFPSQATIAARVGKSERAVRATIAKLVLLGVLVAGARPGGGPIHYRLDAEALPKRPEGSSGGDRKDRPERAEAHVRSERKPTSADPPLIHQRSIESVNARACFRVIENLIGTLGSGETESILDLAAKGYTETDFSIATEAARGQGVRRWPYVRAIIVASEPGEASQPKAKKGEKRGEFSDRFAV